MNNYRFALRNYTGQPVRFFTVEEEVPTTPVVASDPTPSHLIFVVDCSGSMYYDIREIRPMLEKILAVTEFHDSNMIVSLMSYASHGDVKTHFSRVPVEQVMAGGSTHVEEIRQLRTRGLTCISQALAATTSLIQNDETTCISLHSDGYANDYSPSQERREIDRVIGELQKFSNVFVNTVAYRTWSDFQTLSHIANSLSGTCIRANSVREVYNSLHDTSALLTGDMAPVLSSDIGTADFQVFLSTSAQKILGSSEDIVVRGLSATDDTTVYRYTEVTEDQFNASTAPDCGSNNQPLYAYARAQISEGRLNAAKFSVVSTQNGTLLNQHYRALTNQEVADFATDIEQFLYGTTTAFDTTSGFGLDTTKAPILALIDILDSHRDAFKVHMAKFRTGYVRRSVRRVPGTRDEDGNLVKPTLTTTDRGPKNAFLPVNAFEVNQDTATINMRISRPISLTEKDGSVISNVAGIDIDNLYTYNNYTLVGDGSVNAPLLPIQISSKRLFRDLSDQGFVSGSFDPNQVYEIVLKDLPLVDFNTTFDLPDNLNEELFTLVTLGKFFGAMLKDTSVNFTPEQVQELKEHYLSSKLFVNFPTTNEYADLQEALSTGQVDTRLSYKIRVGTPEILNASRLKSGNAFLDRHFVITVEGSKIKKPKLNILFEEGVKVSYKTLSSRTKLTTADALMKPIFEDLLGLTTEYDSGPGAKALQRAGLEISRILDVTARRIVVGDDAVEIITEANRKISQRIKTVYRDDISPLVFYIGATGLIPDEFNAVAMTADELVDKYPDTKPTTAEKEGTFFEVGDCLISVFVKGEHFSTGVAPPVA